MCFTQYYYTYIHMYVENLDVFAIGKLCIFIYMYYTKLSDISDRIQSEMLHAFKEKKMLCTNFRACALHNHHCLLWMLVHYRQNRRETIVYGTIVMIIIAKEKLFFFDFSTFAKNMSVCVWCVQIFVQGCISLLCLFYTHGYYTDVM